MAKTMARVENGLVVNTEWCSDRTQESGVLKDPQGRPVTAGDSYADGKFYRAGVEILTPLEATQAELARLREENADMKSALEILEVTPDGQVE